MPPGRTGLPRWKERIRQILWIENMDHFIRKGYTSDKIKISGNLRPLPQSCPLSKSNQLEKSQDSTATDYDLVVPPQNFTILKGRATRKL